MRPEGTDTPFRTFESKQRPPRTSKRKTRTPKGDTRTPRTPVDPQITSNPSSEENEPDKNPTYYTRVEREVPKENTQDAGGDNRLQGDLGDKKRIEEDPNRVEEGLRRIEEAKTGKKGIVLHMP